MSDRRRVGFRVLALVSVLVAGPSFPAQSPPPDAPSPEEHVVRARETLATSDAAGAADAPGFIEVFGKTFDPPFRSERGVFAAPDGVVYGIGYSGALAALDAREGTLVGASILGTWQSGAVALGVDLDGRVIAVRAQASSRYGVPRTTTWDVSDPSAPAILAETDPCGTGVLLFPDAELGYTWGDDCGLLFEPTTGRRFRTFEPRTVGVGTLRADGHPILLLSRYAGYGNQDLRAYDVTDPSTPIERWRRTVPSGRVGADPGGRIVVVAANDGVALLDARDGRELGSLPAEVASPWFEIAEGDGRTVLAVAGEDDVRLFDVTDPSAPAEFGPPLPLDVIGSGGGWTFAERPLVAHPEHPWIAALTVDPPGVSVIDVRDGGVVGRWESDPDVRPISLAWITLADGSPAFVHTVHHRIELRIPRPAGGLILTDTVSMAVPPEPRHVVRHAPATPSSIQRVVPVAGRYAVVTDLSANAVLLVDLVDGTVLDARGTEGYTYSPAGYSWSVPPSAADGRTVAVSDGRNVQVYEIDGKILRPREFIEPADGTARIGLLDVLGDGTVVVTRTGPDPALATYLPDGRRGRVELPFGPSQFAVRPDGRLVVGTDGTIWAGATSPSLAVDLSDPATPRLLWHREDGALFATFVRDGNALALTKRIGWSYAPVIHDPLTGEPLGTPVDAADPFFYFAPAVAFGQGDGARLLYWHWTWCCWESALFDVATDTPSLVALSSEHFGDSTGLPRDDGVTAYEFRGATYLVGPDGGFEPFDTGRERGRERLRHGFLTAHRVDAGRDPRTLVVLRDPEMNRAPVADAGGDATLECAGPDGTPVVLDGGGSSDPDSTPGTTDDLASWAWSVDGVAVGSAPTVETRVQAGIHAASLRVTDVLGAGDRDDATIAVEDTLAPAVNVELTPVLDPGPVWSQRWIVDGEAFDECDGALEPDRSLVLSGEALAAPTTWMPAATSAVEVVAGHEGVGVRLLGPDRGSVEEMWEAARTRGGFAVSVAPVMLRLDGDPPRGAARGLLARYVLGPDGSLVSGTAYGPGGDHVVGVRARDGAGHEAKASRSVRTVIEDLCAEAPESVACRGGR